MRKEIHDASKIECFSNTSHDHYRHYGRIFGFLFYLLSCEPPSEKSLTQPSGKGKPYTQGNFGTRKSTHKKRENGGKHQRRGFDGGPPPNG